jgi:aminomethyltransferase
MLWKEWAGYHAVRSYGTVLEPEYQALRHAAGLLDVTPLYKYEVRGRGAADFLSWITVRDLRAFKPGRMTYLCWCDDDGKVLDDGTAARLDDDHFRLTAAEPALGWLERHARGFDVRIEDTSRELAALALQGPMSRRILARACDADLAALRWFGITPARFDGAEGWISRTGYTGDLGYEIWVPQQRALAVWDAVLAAGRDFRLLPVGLDALDVARIEAGFIMNGVDYWSAHLCLLEARKSTPYEIGLGWTVKLEREPFLGQRALQAQRSRGVPWRLVGLVYDWEEYEALHAAFGLPPRVAAGAWRTPVPVYDARGEQVGYATSGAWSPLLKQNLALATVRAAHAGAGTRLRIEATVEFQRRRVGAVVTPLPFFEPERKRA